MITFTRSLTYHAQEELYPGARYDILSNLWFVYTHWTSVDHINKMIYTWNCILELVDGLTSNYRIVDAYRFCFVDVMAPLVPTGLCILELVLCITPSWVTFETACATSE